MKNNNIFLKNDIKQYNANEKISLKWYSKIIISIKTHTFLTSSHNETPCRHLAFLCLL